jgi:hypothetical protein
MFGWRKFIDDSGQLGINCAVFRNEGPTLSSLLVRQADAIADHVWPGERHYTYVHPAKVRSANPGYNFLAAGWRRCGRTKGGLLILERPAPVTSLAAIEAACCAATSYWPETWTPANPAHGQCAVTSLVVQDVLGGEIIAGRMAGEDHYWNLVGREAIDLTARQFPADAERVRTRAVRRATLLENVDTRRRYQLLSQRAASQQAKREAA